MAVLLARKQKGLLELSHYAPGPGLMSCTLPTVRRSQSRPFPSETVGIWMLSLQVEVLNFPTQPGQGWGKVSGSRGNFN